MAALKIFSVMLFAFILLNAQETNGTLSARTWRDIYKANRNGPYLGLVIPNLFEMNPLLQSSSFTSTNLTIDLDGRRFRFGTVGEKKVILVMTGLGMPNLPLPRPTPPCFGEPHRLFHRHHLTPASPLTPVSLSHALSSSLSVVRSPNGFDVAVPPYAILRRHHLHVGSLLSHRPSPSSELGLHLRAVCSHEIYLSLARVLHTHGGDPPPLATAPPPGPPFATDHLS